ncbi:MAG: hypothetical protein WC374_13855 [Phycisphaerae bacterium]
MTPTDADAYFDVPPFQAKEYDVAHVSVTFTEDIEWGQFLCQQWAKYTNTTIGGPAFGDEGGEFVPGLYLKPGVTITSGGCCNNCSFCVVPKREGKIRTLEIKPGHTIQDNNLLACPDDHIAKVFEMLKSQKQIDFAGGLEAARITDSVVDKLRGLSVKQLWIAYDDSGRWSLVLRAIERLKQHFPQRKIRCYVLIGYGDDTLDKAEGRLRQVFDAGGLPFAMLYSPGHTEQKWKLLQRTFTRPAATLAYMKNSKDSIREVVGAK